MPYAVTGWLDRWLRPGMTAFEYGSGGSTLWLAKRVGRLTSIEHDRGWYEAVQAELASNRVENCTLALREPESAANGNSAAYASEVIPATFEAYVRAVEAVPDETLDLVVIDGRSRAAAIEAARDKIRPGGAIVLDDSDRPRYQAAQRKLAGWRHHRFHGIKPFVVKPAVTSVWLKPE
jgi:predicted O-methyltransferase YrrM